MSNLIVKRRIELVKAASEVVAELDPSIRAEAFRFLLQSEVPPATASISASNTSASPTTGLTEFFKERRGANPAANAVQIAGYLYSSYGDEAFDLDEVKNVAKQVGLILPSRLDMTFVSAQRDGRSLFTRAGTAKFRPTVNGELHFQREGIAKGSRSRSVNGSGSVD